MAKIKSIDLASDQRAALEQASRHGKSHSFRQRCQMILLKSERRTSKEVAKQIGCCEVVVNSWMKRYQEQGFDGLKTKAGQGRLPILSKETDLKETDLAAVRLAVQQNRQRVSLAKAELTQKLGKEFSTQTLQRVFHPDIDPLSEKNGGRFKRIRRAIKHKPNADLYAFKCAVLCAVLAEFETLSQQGHIDVFYDDESRVSLLPCVPYGWQFKDEQVTMPSERGGGVNCFALLCRDNRLHLGLTQETIDAAFISEQLDTFSWSVRRPTVVVLDNARVHAKAVRERSQVWQERGLFVWFLPTYSPHLNIVETLWRKLKYEWLRPEDYADKDTLRLAVWQALTAVGSTLNIAFSAFKATQNSLT
jgi:transposase